MDVNQIAATLARVFTGLRPGDKQWTHADDEALNFALIDHPMAHDAQLAWMQRAMEAEAKLRDALGASVHERLQPPPDSHG